MKLFFLLASLIFTKELEVEVDDKKIIDPTKTNDDNSFEDKRNTQICNTLPSFDSLKQGTLPSNDVFVKGTSLITETEQSISTKTNDDNSFGNTLQICNNSLTTKSEQRISTKTNDDKTFFTSKDYINSSDEILHDELFFTFFTFFMFLF
jgi:hypothetical protein